MFLEVILQLYQETKRMICCLVLTFPFSGLSFTAQEICEEPKEQRSKGHEVGKEFSSHFCLSLISITGPAREW